MDPDLSHTITHHPHPFRPSSSSPSTRQAAARDMPSPSTIRPTSPPIDERASAATTATDVESQVTVTGAGSRVGHASGHIAATSRLPRLNRESDPYDLQSAFKSDSDLADIRANSSRKRDGPGRNAVSSLSKCTPGFVGSKNRQANRIRGFYVTQNAAIERMLKSVEEHVAEARQEQGDDHFRVQVAIYGSFAANILLTGLQLYAAIASGSLSLFTTMADAIFDPLSNITLILTARAVRRVDPRRFPAGKARLETVGNIVFCFLMTSVSLIIIAFAARELATRDAEKEVNEFHLPAVISVCAAFATKLGLFLYCWSLKDRYSQVRVLWQDHRNDLFVNGFGILTAVGGAKLKWWIDPAGATVLSVLISILWLRTAFGEFMLLVGVGASVETQQLITYVCLTHSEAIRGIDTVRVYHSGPRLIAEVDIVMDPASSLANTHDVAEALQMKLESLPDIERSYVHIDYETTHKPEHAWKKDL